MIESSIKDIDMGRFQKRINHSEANVFDFRRKLNAPRMQFIFDVISLILIYTIHFFIRFYSGFFGYAVNPDIFSIFSSAFVLTGYWLLLFWLTGLYKDWYIRSPFIELYTIIKVSLFGTFFIFFFVFLDSNSPRLLFLVYLALFIFVTSIGRLVARKIQKKLRANHIISIPVIIIGTAIEVKDLLLQINVSQFWGYRPIGIILINKDEIVKWDKLWNGSNDIPVLLGTIEMLSNIFDVLSPEEVLIAVDNPEHQLLMKITSLCAEKKLPMKIVPDMYDFFTGQTRAFHLYGIPLIEINTQLLTPWQSITKRAMDILISIILLIIGFPFWVIISIIIKIETIGPIFYKQVRVGKDGLHFITIKFRSMIQDAEKHGPQWAQINDKRVTKFGRFLRKTHLDEVPQFWNVLKGEMSIVGPRPERPVFVDKFSEIAPYYKRRLVVRPGITGWHQVNNSSYVESKEEIDKRLKADFYYIENISFGLDFEIIVRTILHMIRGHGQA